MLQLREFVYSVYEQPDVVEYVLSAGGGGEWEKGTIDDL